MQRRLCWDILALIGVSMEIERIQLQEDRNGGEPLGDGGDGSSLFW